MRQLRLVLTASAVAAVTALTPTTASADKPGYGCPPGFNLGAHALTAEDYASLPRSQAAIDAGLIDVEGILAGASFYDKNGNGVVCVQLSNGFETWADARPFGEYLYNVVDDASSAP
jgi:hypothetical protein